jgi:hypothetical protein
MNQDNQDDTAHRRIFHIRRSATDVLCLHPFEKHESVTDLEQISLHGLYGRDPDLEYLHTLRSDLYRDIERAVQRDVLDNRFVVRFPVAAAAFAVSYLFLSLFLRDPIPMLDEIFISSLSAVLVYRKLGRVFLQSSEVTETLTELKARVDSTLFVESAFVSAVEETIRSFDVLPLDMVIRDVLDPAVARSLVSRKYIDETREMVRYLEPRFSSIGHRRWKRRFPGVFGRELSKRDRKSLEAWIVKKDIDFPLFALYLVLVNGLKELSMVQDRAYRSIEGLREYR